MEEKFIKLNNEKEELLADIWENEQSNDKFDHDLVNARAELERIQKEHNFEHNHLKWTQENEPPLIEDVQKLSTIPEALVNDIKTHEEHLAVEEKRLKFANEIKMFNLDDIKIVQESNDHINHTLNNFMRKYDEIKRLGNTGGGPKNESTLFNPEIKEITHNEPHNAVNIPPNKTESRMPEKCRGCFRSLPKT